MIFNLRIEWLLLLMEEIILFQETNFKEPLRIFSEDELEKMKLRYYTPEIHRSAFIHPRFAEKALLPVKENKEEKE